MSLNIKNPEAHALAHRLAELTGESMSQAVIAALKERLERLGGERGEVIAARIKRARAIVDDMRRRLSPETLAVAHGELLYDENGLPK
ncbi:MAG: type II toxin-antitoxin system VapB family antitoxin [Alphaproteobacteria bacterium]|nr:type II toxin-antitoxin system VapB family antitoxin [Alphaproteobacteria bacterium]